MVYSFSSAAYNTYCFSEYVFGECEYVCTYSTGVMKSVQWEAMDRTVRVCVTALMVHAVITSTVAACVSRASVDPSVHTGCA